MKRFPFSNLAAFALALAVLIASFNWHRDASSSRTGSYFGYTLKITVRDYTHLTIVFDRGNDFHFKVQV